MTSEQNAGNYQALEERFARLGQLGQVLELLHWDQATMMPSGASDDRAQQIATLQVIRHDLLSDDSIHGQIEEALQGETLSEWQRSNLQEMKHQIAHVTAVPADLIQAATTAATKCNMTWRTARADNDFQTLAPLLQEVFHLTRQEAQAKSEALDLPLYDALMDYYEPGATSAQVDQLFGRLEAFLPEFVDQVIEKQNRSTPSIPLAGPFDIQQQRDTGRRIMELLGFEFNHGRLDESLHPFCSGSARDVRITSRYSEDDFVSGLMAVIHETGHALYEQGLPREWRYQPVGQARGMAMHESQSLIMEMQACRSPEFMELLAPMVARDFGGSGDAWSAENLYRLYTRVERSLIRVDADEVTYPLHVVLRYRLEKALLTGDLQVIDLPDAWREGMKDLVGIDVPDDRSGCMQDIHWVQGSVGYFPSYTLGAMTAAQLFRAARQQNPEVVPGIRSGNLVPLVEWLRTNVHHQASLLSSEELLQRATGEGLNADIFIEHLQHRYLGNDPQVQ